MCQNWGQVHHQSRQPTIEEVNKTAFSLSTAGPRWRFIVESGAAGLPYLRAMRLNNRPGVAGLAKLLVVDVGAGSTDVGYMLKTSNVSTGAPTLYYFHPASTFAEAGNALTEELVKYHRAQNKPITWAEAEAEKIANTGWHEIPFVQLWIRHICDHVAQYILGVPDERWLPLPVKLHMVVTGGSGLVPGLKKQMHDAVINALATRQFDFGQADEDGRPSLGVAGICPPRMPSGLHSPAAVRSPASRSRCRGSKRSEQFGGWFENLSMAVPIMQRSDMIVLL